MYSNQPSDLSFSLTSLLLPHGGHSLRGRVRGSWGSYDSAPVAHGVWSNAGISWPKEVGKVDDLFRPRSRARDSCQSQKLGAPASPEISSFRTFTFYRVRYGIGLLTESDCCKKGFDNSSFMSEINTTISHHLSRQVGPLGLKIWEVIGLSVGILMLCALLLLVIYVTVQNKRRSKWASNDLPITQIPAFSTEIKEIHVDQKSVSHEGVYIVIHEKSSEEVSENDMVQSGLCNADSNGLCKDGNAHHGEDGTGKNANYIRSHLQPLIPSPMTGLAQFSQPGWGYWYTLRELEMATNRFSKDNVIGEGGYGIVYQGKLMNKTPVAVKRLFNNLGQAEKEFRVEVEAIGHVRHKNLVRLLGYCIEGTERMLVYEYVDNGNLEQWLHGSTQGHSCLTWEARMKILLGTAKALAYLHEAVEPKVVHRDIKSSNILIDNDFNAKVSDFGLAKLLGSGKSHVSTRVMGTFGYVAPEYAHTGLLNEKSDVYSFGILLLEVITGRDPVDYGRPTNEVNLVDWLKVMVGAKRSAEVVDPNILTRPSTKALKRVLLVALQCIDSNSQRRPTMSQIVQMLESRKHISNKETGHQSNKLGSLEKSHTDIYENPGSRSDSRRK